MYGGFAYAGAPYAGGSTTSTPVAPSVEGGAVRMREGGGVYVETDAAVSLPSAVGYRMDVVRVFPIPDLVSGRPT